MPGAHHQPHLTLHVMLREVMNKLKMACRPDEAAGTGQPAELLPLWRRADVAGQTGRSSSPVQRVSRGTKVILTAASRGFP